MTAQRKPCGTSWGPYRRHLRKPEPTCARCRAFVAAYIAAARARKKETS